MIAAEQSTLEGVDLPPVVLPDVPVRVAIMGRLARHAELRYCGAGGEHLCVLIEQRVAGHPLAVPIKATRVYEDIGSPNATHQVAHAAAMRLRAGADVVAIGSGLEKTTHDGHPVLRLIDVVEIKPVDFFGGNDREPA